MSVRGPVRHGVDLAVGESRNVWDLSVLERTCCFSSSRAFAVFLVGCDVEEDKEDEVGGDRDDTGESGKFFSCAFARVWQPGPVGRGEVCVGCEVDEACSERAD